jgi:hypothetical protein
VRAEFEPEAIRGALSACDFERNSLSGIAIWGWVNYYTEYDTEFSLSYQIVTNGINFSFS